MAQKILSTLIRFYEGTVTRSGSEGSYTYSFTKDSTAGAENGIPDCVSLPAMGATPEKVEVTTLGSEVRQYVKGLKDYGDLEFGFRFDVDDTIGSSSTAKTVYEYLQSFEGANHYWEVSFPAISGGVLTPDAGLKFYFYGEPSVAMGAAEVGNAVDFSMTIALASDISTELEKVYKG